MKIRNAVVAYSAALTAGLSQAAVDTAGITSAISDAGTAAGVVGAAVLVMIVGIKVYKWVRGAM